MSHSPTDERPPVGREATREALIEATAQIMVDEGYAAATSRRVAAKAGVKAALVHYYFPSMDDLFVAVQRRTRRAVVHRIPGDGQPPQGHPQRDHLVRNAFPRHRRGRDDPGAEGPRRRSRVVSPGGHVDDHGQPGADGAARAGTRPHWRARPS